MDPSEPETKNGRPADGLDEAGRPAGAAPAEGTAPGGAGPDDHEGGSLRGRLLGRRRKISEEAFERRFSAQFAQQWSHHWAQVRAERRHEEARAETPSVHPGRTNFSRAEVPYGVDLAAAWSWRFIVIVIAGYFIARTIGFLSLVVMPVIIALFISALVIPVVEWLTLIVRRGVAAFVVLVGVITILALMITFATQQVVNGATDLANQVVSGLDEIRHWLETGPLHVTDKQINNAIAEVQDLVTTSNAQLVNRVQSVGTTIGHIVAAFFIVLFSTYFFLADGQGIWAWVVRIFPRAARARADSSGRVAWLSLTQFVRATVLVALVDAVGVMLVAAILRVPFVLAIGVLVFLGAFIPLVGATISGSVAILVALVAQGPIVALIMLGGVIGVQQLEAHVLQPFLLGRMVAVHPLAVILGIASGAYFAGIPGALVAVPLIASMNAVVVYLNTAPKEPEEGGPDVEVDNGPDGGTPEAAPPARP
jgi:predicted PurR-regulated permease PerM